MRLLVIIGLVWAAVTISRAAEEIVEVTATLIPVEQAKVDSLTQVELKKELLLARNRGAVKLLQLSAVVESGKWATIRQGREFWYPDKYSAAKVYKADGDKKEYSVPTAGSSFSKSTVVLPTSPTEMKRIDLGAYLKVRPTVKDDGRIYIEGELNDVVFEGLSQEALPITFKTGQLIKGKQEHEILVSRLDKPLFHRFSKEFGVMLPFGSGNTESSKQFRKAQSKFDYMIPVRLGDNIFGAQGKIDLGNIKSDKKGIIRPTMIRASSRAEILKDALIRKKDRPEQPRKNAILVLEVKKIPSVSSGQTSAAKVYRLESKFVESSEPLAIDKPVMSFAEFQNVYSSSKTIELITAPSVIVEAGESGKVGVVKEFVFPTRFEDPKVIAAIDSKFAKPLEFQTRSVGNTFEVAVENRSNNRVGLTIKTNDTHFEGMLNYGNPIMALKSGGMIKLKPTIESENLAEVPVFPFRSSETEITIPNDSVVAVTMIHDRFNENHSKGRLLKIGQPKTQEVTVARYLTVFIHVNAQ